MSAQPRQRGQLRVITCADCERLARQRDAAILDMENAEIALRAERAKTKRFKRMLDDKQREHHDYDTVKALFDYWKQQASSSRSALDANRIQLCLRAMKNYTPREIAMALRGNVSCGRRDPFGTILRNADMVEKNIARWETYCRSNRVTFDRGPVKEENQ